MTKLFETSAPPLITPYKPPLKESSSTITMPKSNTSSKPTTTNYNWWSGIPSVKTGILSSLDTLSFLDPYSSKDALVSLYLEKESERIRYKNKFEKLKEDFDKLEEELKLLKKKCDSDSDSDEDKGKGKDKEFKKKLNELQKTFDEFKKKYEK